MRSACPEFVTSILQVSWLARSAPPRTESAPPRPRHQRSDREQGRPKRRLHGDPRRVEPGLQLPYDREALQISRAVLPNGHRIAELDERRVMGLVLQCRGRGERVAHPARLLTSRAESSPDDGVTGLGKLALQVRDALFVQARNRSSSERRAFADSLDCSIATSGNGAAGFGRTVIGGWPRCVNAFRAPQTNAPHMPMAASAARRAAVSAPTGPAVGHEGVRQTPASQTQSGTWRPASR